ncbi:MAG: GH3 auxin-responsive promoter family protein [Oscillospiraceae bacterium]|nr:GH3 auxin-responsive promoter family protein [Oscillospiraceae bacterium]
MALSDLGVMLGNMVFKGVNHFTSVPVETQEKILLQIMDKNKDTEYGRKIGFKNVHSVADFQRIVPLTTYEDYDEYVERMLNGESNLMMAAKCVRYCSSSGSVGKPKVLPKSAKDIFNMQSMGFAATPACAAKWFKKNGMKFPKQVGPVAVILTGHEMKDGKMCNGAGQVPFTYLKPISKFFMTTPNDFLYPENEEAVDSSYFHLRFALQRRDLTYLGSMVVTLLTTMFDYFEHNWEMVCDDIEKGTIDPSVKCPDDLRKKWEKKFKPMPERAEEIRRECRKGFDTPIAPRIWPDFVWSYGMVGSNLKFYVQKLRKYIGDAPIHNMGYAAAEGYMAMPVELNVNDYVLLPRSLFFEFIPVDDPDCERPLTIGEIEVGKDYELVVTNFSGLYRYKIEDVVRVTGYYNKTPKVEFLYRNNLAMNIANEKTTTQMVDWAAVKTQEKLGISFKGYSFYADTNVDPVRYMLLAEPEGDISYDMIPQIEDTLNEFLCESNEKYFKYRRWGMLAAPKVCFLKKDTYADYREMLKKQGKVLNQIKPVTVINTPEREEFFLSHIDEATKD